jgi:hypothetical protein
VFENDFTSSMRLPDNASIFTAEIQIQLECAGQVGIWSWFDNFWQSYGPFT